MRRSAGTVGSDLSFGEDEDEEGATPFERLEEACMRSWRRKVSAMARARGEGVLLLFGDDEEELLLGNQA
jgi:hypothetical protein